MIVQVRQTYAVCNAMHQIQIQMLSHALRGAEYVKHAKKEQFGVIPALLLTVKLSLINVRILAIVNTDVLQLEPLLYQAYQEIDVKCFEMMVKAVVIRMTVKIVCIINQTAETVFAYAILTLALEADVAVQKTIQISRVDVEVFPIGETLINVGHRGLEGMVFLVEVFPEMEEVAMMTEAGMMMVEAGMMMVEVEVVLAIAVRNLFVTLLIPSTPVLMQGSASVGLMKPLVVSTSTVTVTFGVK